jgi:hypothetical protein
MVLIDLQAGVFIGVFIAEKKLQKQKHFDFDFCVLISNTEGILIEKLAPIE